MYDYRKQKLHYLVWFSKNVSVIHMTTNLKGEGKKI